jgi:hypothetical protein
MRSAARRVRYPPTAECCAQIAVCRDGPLPLEPYQLVSQHKLEPLLKEGAEGTPNVTVRYRDGRVFLAADAMHLVIPTGGLGMSGRGRSILEARGRDQRLGLAGSA